jgi:hypothetical protein
MEVKYSSTLLFKISKIRFGKTPNNNVKNAKITKIMYSNLNISLLFNKCLEGTP